MNFDLFCRTSALGGADEEQKKSPNFNFQEQVSHLSLHFTLVIIFKLKFFWRIQSLFGTAWITDGMKHVINSIESEWIGH